MADDSGLSVAQKNETNKEIEVLKKAAKGELSWFSRDVLMVGAKFGAGGGTGVVLGRYVGHKYFPDDTLADDDPEHDAYALYKRAATKVGVGLVLASGLRRVSPVAAAGSAICTIGDAVADVIEQPITEQLDDWFSDEETGTTTPATGRVYVRRVG